MHMMPSTQTVRLASTDDIPEGTGREFKVGERYVAIFKVDGLFYALEDMCPHAGAPLNNGPIRDGTVMCLWHGWCFNLHDGVCVTPARGRAVPVYPMMIRGQDIYVTLPTDGTVASQP